MELCKLDFLEFILTVPKLLFYWQVRIRAYDTAFPNIFGETDLTVTVNRNLNGPDANSVTLTVPEKIIL